MPGLFALHDGGNGAGPEDRLAAADARETFRQMGGVPEEILYDRMKTQVVRGISLSSCAEGLDGR